MDDYNFWEVSFFSFFFNVSPSTHHHLDVILLLKVLVVIYYNVFHGLLWYN